jgi:hypothetical protein
MKTLTVVAMLLWSGAAAAQGQGWSYLSGETVGAGANVLEGEMGFPGIGFAFDHGVSEAFDLGAELHLNYGFEGSTADLLPGLKAQALVRVRLLKNESFNLGLRFEPGVMMYFVSGQGLCFGNACYDNAYNLVAFALPVELNLGIPASAAIMLHGTLSVPFMVVVGSGRDSGPVMPILFGAGAEYFISKKMAVSFDARMGPTVWFNNFAYFTFQAQFGLSYHL